MEKEQIVSLTADIVAAHVANNTVSVGDVATLVERVYESLAALAAPPQAAPQEVAKEPVVSVRASVKPDYIVCMECGRKQKTLKRHLRVAHGMSPEQYRSDYGLPGSYPMVAPNYSDQRRSLARSSGLGRKRAPEPASATEEPAKPARGRGRPKKNPAS